MDGSLSIIFCQPETKGFRKSDSKLSPPTDSESDFLSFLKVKVTQLCLILCDPMDCILHGLYSPWDSPGQNTGVGSLSLLQGIFPAQESNRDLLYCR